MLRTGSLRKISTQKSETMYTIRCPYSIVDIYQQFNGSHKPDTL